MDRLDSACSKHREYPQNLVGTSALAHQQQRRFTRLHEEQQRLFCDETKARLRFLEFGDQSTDWFLFEKKTLDDVWAHLFEPKTRTVADARCRYTFVQAPTARDRLNTTKDMLTLLLTYQQVMPEFVDFLFPFGKQTTSKDFHFSAFRHRSQLHGTAQGLVIEELGWSGRNLEICYNLKSVEESPTQIDRPWSIRHCAVSHTFDVKTGRTSWIIVKANKLMQNRLSQATNHDGLPEMQDPSSVEKAFVATLVTHQIVSDWSAESWRWYINWLEEKQQEISHRTVSNEIIAAAPIATKNPTKASWPRQAQAEGSVTSFQPKFLRSRSATLKTLATMEEEQDLDQEKAHTFVHRDSGLSQPLPYSVVPEVPGEDTLPTHSSIKYDEFGQREFSFRDLQELHFIDIQADEAALVIEHQMSVLEQLLEYYSYICGLANFPQDVVSKCAEKLSHFRKHIQDIILDLKMQASRLGSLQRTTADCKILVESCFPFSLSYANSQKLHRIMDFQNTQSNRLLALESRASTQKMEHVTNEMKTIARKTQTETVSMKIITAVTLFFLPGTFISTLMSTSIFQGKQIVHPGPNPFLRLSPLQLYCILSIPLTFVTLLFWALFHLWEKRKEDFREMESYAIRNGLLCPKNPAV